MGLVDKLKQQFDGPHIVNPLSHNKESEPLNSQEDIKVDRRSIYRNRFNNGVNLGSLFVLEPWIFESKLNEFGGNSELEYITNLRNRTSSNEAVNRLQNHYKEYMNRINWNWLRDVGHVTALRVPIGYWHVNNGAFTDGLPFQPLKEIYQRTKPWDSLKSLIDKAKQYNIGILIDIHGLPGGANGDSHSGDTSGNASFFHTPKYVNKMVDEVIPFIVNDIARRYENVIGLQVVNEAKFDEKAKDEQVYYEKAIRAINKIDSGLPIIISDGWWPQQWADWLAQKKFDTFVVVDSHVYRCFSEEDKSQSADQIIQNLPKGVNFPSNKADFVVGEFSCVLDGKTWSKTNGDRQGWVKKYGNEQIKLFNKLSSWGWFFWTLQFQWGDGGEWGFIPQVNNGAIPVRSKRAANIDKAKINAIIREHIKYWNGKGDKFEHERFEAGIKQAAADIEEFDKFDNSRVGRLHSWMLMRRAQHIKSHGNSEFIWEWEQGFQRGISEFNN
ncbi:hypothetical protein MOSE0_J01882 [Monosporozyma servazzii]